MLDLDELDAGDGGQDGAALEPMITYGTNPGMGIPLSGAVPEPANATAAKALAYMGLAAKQPLLGHKVDVVFIGRPAVLVRPFREIRSDMQETMDALRRRVARTTGR